MEDFDTMEKAADTELWLYQITVKKVDDQNVSSIRVMRTGKNLSVDPTRVIHLCHIENSYHIALIEDIQKFIHNCWLISFTLRDI